MQLLRRNARDWIGVSSAMENLTPQRTSWAHVSGIPVIIIFVLYAMKHYAADRLETRMPKGLLGGRLLV